MNRSSSTSSETGRQIRGSLLLLLGRLLSLGVNFGVQVLIVRHLSKSDFGAFAYALTVASLGSSVALLGLDRVVAVFVPRYEERREFDRMLGTVVLVLGTTMSVALAIVLLVLAFRVRVADAIGIDQQATAMLSILVALVPVQVLDSLLGSAFAILGNPRAIFFRAYVLAPGLRFTAVLWLALTQSDVFVLAYGYVVAAVVSVGVCTLLLLRMLAGRHILSRFRRARLTWPVKAVSSFTAPLIVSDLRVALGSAAAVLIVEHFRGTLEVATLRAVLPISMLNLMVLQSFKQLFTPLASRMIARKDDAGLSDLYRQSTLWIAVLTFPVLLATFSFSRPLLVLLYGHRYEEASAVLAILSIGYYFSAALGFNGLTLRMLGRSRFTIITDLIGAVVGCGVTVLLVPRFGATGAAVSISATLIVLNIVYQIGLDRTTDLNLLHWRSMKVYLLLASGAATGLVVQQVLNPPIYASIAVAAAVAGGVTAFSIASLDFGGIFPELLRHRVARRWLGPPIARGAS